jgi:hypothetical protein
MNLLSRAGALAALGTASLVALALTPQTATAHDEPGYKADGHAPAGVMVDHMHKAGELMLGYRYSDAAWGSTMLHGTAKASDHEIVHNACGTGHGAGCSMTPESMKMRMHMLDIMYAPTDWLTLMVMPQFMSMDMSMRELAGGHGHGHAGGHEHGTEGLGDTVLAALFRLSSGPGYHLHAGLGLSAPTGSVTEKTPDGKFTHYGMQLGSGTWDLLPSLTYTGRAGRLAWGAQASGIIRLEDENEAGFRFGNVFQATAWGSYRIADWLSASVRLVHTYQGGIEGHYDGAHNHHSPPDLQGNYGGHFYDVGIGLNTVVPAGPLAGHRLGIEWLEPVRDDVNGYQQQRDGTLIVSWSKAF